MMTDDLRDRRQMDLVGFVSHKDLRVSAPAERGAASVATAELQAADLSEPLPVEGSIPSSPAASQMLVACHAAPQPADAVARPAIYTAAAATHAKVSGAAPKAIAVVRGDGPGGGLAVSEVIGAGAPQAWLMLRGLIDNGHTLAHFVGRYLSERVLGQSPNTLAAKSRDLTAFTTWFIEMNDHGDISRWLVRDTLMFLRSREGRGLAPTSINRSLATLRHFSRWVHELPGGIFKAGGLPTAGVRELVTEEPDCKKLGRKEIYALFKAADNLVLLGQHKKARARRNRALLAVLYYTGLRVQELVMLRREQYDGTYLHNVARKGRIRTKKVFLVADCRRHLDEYLNEERILDDAVGNVEPLFLPWQSATYMNRRDVARALDTIAAEASKNRVEMIDVHPHRLRHTFGAEHRERFGSDTETAAALGHTGSKYVGRYVRKSQGERDAMLEEMFNRL